MKVAVAHFSGQKTWLKEELERLGCEVIEAEGSKIMLYSGDGIGAFFNGHDLSKADCLVLFPEKNKIEFCYQLAKICETFIPVSASSKTLFLFKNRALLQRFLAANGIKVRKLYVFSEVTAASVVLKKLKLPVILQFPDGKRIPVKNEDTFRELISALPKDTVLTAEKPLKPEYVLKTLVIGDEILAFEKSGEKTKGVSVSGEVCEIAEKLRKILGLWFFSVDILPYKKSFLVNDIWLNPDFELYETVTGRNVKKLLAETIVERAKKERIEMVKETVKKSLHAIVRWLSEIGSSGSGEKNV